MAIIQTFTVVLVFFLGSIFALQYAFGLSLSVSTISQTCLVYQKIMNSYTLSIGCGGETEFYFDTNEYIINAMPYNYYSYMSIDGLYKVHWSFSFNISSGNATNFTAEIYTDSGLVYTQDFTALQSGNTIVNISTIVNIHAANNGYIGFYLKNNDLTHDSVLNILSGNIAILHQSSL